MMMRSSKFILICTVLLFFAIGIYGCAQDKEPTILNTYEQTPLILVGALVENGKEVTTISYYEMSDGTWKTDEYTYKHKLIISNNANYTENDIAYTVLSNFENISFEQVLKASGFSSNPNDYFKPEETVIVARTIS